MRTSDTPSRQVLDLLGRVITFLTALGTVVELRAILASAGYEDATTRRDGTSFTRQPASSGARRKRRR